MEVDGTTNGITKGRFMRDPKRIPIILGRIQKTWEKCSGLRFGQMMINFCSYLEGKGINMYGIEDDEFIEEFEEFYERLLNDLNF